MELDELIAFRESENLKPGASEVWNSTRSNIALILSKDFLTLLSHNFLSKVYSFLVY